MNSKKRGPWRSGSAHVWGACGRWFESSRPEMSFYFTNSVSGQKEQFVSYNKSEVRIYSCGPTVYDRAHIGNFRSYLFSDLLRRSLKLGGYIVHQVVNLTDIDDKTINATLKKNRQADLADLDNYTKPFIEGFFEDLKKMNIEMVEHYPRATKNIPEMIELVEKLLKKENAYSQDGNIYFNISSFKNYGNLSGIDLSGIKSGIRYNVDEYDKEDVRDFVLWKSDKEEGQIGWQSPFGFGRPGWHLECSAMIEAKFKGPIDIHTGGVDLIFPHHENEIAQSVCAFDHEFVRTWMHCEHLLVDGKKMSKSQGNFYTLEDIFKRGFDPRALRYALISVHYRQKLNFTLKSMDSAAQNIKKIDNFYERIEFSAEKEDLPRLFSENSKKWISEILFSLQDDLNIAKALAIFHESLNEMNAYLDKNRDYCHPDDKKAILGYLEKSDSIFGFAGKKQDNYAANETLLLALKNRNLARQSKDFKEADRIRDEILKQGFEILDTPQGSRLRKISET